MATPAMMPAGWYADPTRRHECRYWGGTDWTGAVSDGAVTATDPLEFASQPPPSSPQPPLPSPEPPLPSPQHPAEFSPVTAPAVPAVVRRGRGSRAVAMIAIAVVAVAGVIAGLVIWAPWQSPPLLRPAGLVAGPSTTSSVAFRWSGPATGPAPDRYMIMHDRKVIGSIPGTVTSYRGTGLAPATAYRYRVVAVRGGKRSAASAIIVVTTLTPPISAARWQGPWNVSLKIVRGGADLTAPSSWVESWQANPKCAAGACAVVLSRGINGHTFKVTLARAGSVYSGGRYAAAAVLETPLTSHLRTWTTRRHSSCPVSSAISCANSPTNRHPFRHPRKLSGHQVKFFPKPAGLSAIDSERSA